MIDGVSQLGILMLLLLTGMETDLPLVQRVGRAAPSWSPSPASPFRSPAALALGELLPDSLLPRPDARLVTALFLGTALSISSVKIVAMVVREMNFMRRDHRPDHRRLRHPRRHDRLGHHRHRLRARVGGHASTSGRSRAAVIGNGAVSWREPHRSAGASCSS